MGSGDVEIVIRAAGGVVFSRDQHNRDVVLLIQDKHGVWTLPKGHVDPGETEEQTAVREITEETGVVCEVERLIQQVQYPVFKKGTWRDKTVAYFLARADYIEPVPCQEEGIRSASWIAPDQAVGMIGYSQVREVVRRSLALRKL